MRPRAYAFVVLMVALIIGLYGLHSQSQPDSDTKDVMKFKLHYSQRVLEGIATENYDVIADNAKKLRILSQQADWQIRQTPEYQKFTADFARHADGLLRAAKDQNVDAATVAYFQLTVSCSTCHRYLRGEKGVGSHRIKEWHGAQTIANKR